MCLVGSKMHGLSAKKPTEEEEKQINEIAPPDRGMRLEALCSIDADGEIIHTAIVHSLPKL